MGFSPDGKLLYHTDSLAGAISVFDYDATTGEIARPRLFAKPAIANGGPDGLAVDAEGYVWSACWGGSCVHRYTPGGALDTVIQVPVHQVSSLAFGGPSLEDVFITCAALTPDERKAPGWGGLYRLRSGIRGLATFRSGLACKG